MTAESITKVCSIENCEGKRFCRDLCNKHFWRLRRYGDPNISKQIHGDNTARFWSQVTKTEGCWIWTGSQDEHGYGQIYVDGKLELVHRFSFFLEYGHYPTPVGRHRCDNPSCVRPDHIIEGTRAQNAQDMVERGRSAKGSRHSQAKLTEIDVQSIRQLIAAGKPDNAIAADFGVSGGAIYHVRVGNTWKHIQ